MKTCCLVWEIPVIEGEHYNPIINVIYMQKAKKFLNQLNRYFQDENMDWKCVLDRSACTYNEIFSSENQAVIFVPEAKTRQWLYKKEIQAVSIPKYYLDFAEYNEGKLDKIAIFFMNLKNNVQQIFWLWNNDMGYSIQLFNFLEFLSEESSRLCWKNFIVYSGTVCL